MVETAQPATILLVDDDQISILSLKRALKRLGVANDTVVARNGAQAIDILFAAAAAQEDARPNFVVVLDVNMPQMNGWEFLERVSQRVLPARLSVLIFAQPAQVARHARAPHDCVVGYLEKDDPASGLAAAFMQMGDASGIVRHAS